MAPILGTIGDYRGKKMQLFRFFFIIGVLSTAALSFTDQWALILIIYMVTIVGFSAANLFYDAFLIDVTSAERMDLVSTYGFALGYIGGSTIPFIISIGLILFGSKIGIGSSLAVKISFMLTAVWWTVFAVPMLKNVKQIYYIESEENIIGKSFLRLYKTFMNIREYKSVFIFLLAYFFYIDGVNTIIRMATVYGDSVGVGSNSLLLALLMTQIVAFPFAIIYGKLAKKVGTRNI